MKVAIYARVSTVDQNCEMQLRELREYTTRRGWDIAHEYIDAGWSGMKASRPQLDRMMKDAREHRFDAVLVWKLDRFGRSVTNLYDSLDRLRAAGVRFIATSQGMDTDESSPTGRLIFGILALVAEFEREMIKERCASGLRTYSEALKQGRVGVERKSKSGKNLVVGRPRCVVDRTRVATLQAEGASIRAIAKQLGLSVGTISRALNATGRP